MLLSIRRLLTWLALPVLILSLAQCQPAASSAAATDEPSAGNTPDSVLLAKGRAIAGETFTALSGALKKAMNEGGAPAAIEYCNLAALPLTDSLSALHGVQIRRVTDQPRNPLNEVNEAEKAIMAGYYDALAQGGMLAPQLQQDGEGRTVFYAPIVLMDFCEQCHGVPGASLPEDNLAVIQEKYPADQATGYRAGELRGMWSITFLR